MWVKICGNTRLEDCLLASELGADAVGFVFAAGKRTVDARQVAAVTAQLPPTLEKIGVFTSRDAASIACAAKHAGLTGVQLHGEPNRDFLEAVNARLACKVIQVVHWRTDLPSSEQQERFALQIDSLNTWALADAVLIDSQTANASGGTGMAFDWAAVAPLLQQSMLPVIVAGGLKPESVSAAIATLNPWGVDVSSGVEKAPGVKDAGKLRAFVAAARA